MSQSLNKQLSVSSDAENMARMLKSIGLGLLVVAVLFWTMQYMIKIGAGVETGDNSVRMPEFVQAKLDNKINRRKPPKKPPPPEKPPKQPPPPKLENLKTQAGTIEVSATPVNTDVALSGSGFNVGAIGEGDYLPIVKIQPMYPPRAADRGVEGHCTVAYTVTKNGTTANVRVVSDDCTSSLFHRASIRAAEKFKYKPTVLNGEAIEVDNVKNRFTYTLED